MPGAGFKTFVAGDVLTASDVNTYLMQQAIMVFTNEAARDATITAPSEGMHAYLTASTVATAAGGSTAVPTGILTIYNGTSWVCVTPVGSKTTNTGTTTSLSFTATLSGSPGTNPSVTLTTGTVALVTYSVITSVTGGNTSVTSFAVSGATTRAAVEDESVYTQDANSRGLGRMIVVTGLTAGANTFTMQYRTSGGTSSFLNRQISVTSIQ